MPNGAGARSQVNDNQSKSQFQEVRRVQGSYQESIHKCQAKGLIPNPEPRSGNGVSQASKQRSECTQTSLLTCCFRKGIFLSRGLYGHLVD